MNGIDFLLTISGHPRILLYPVTIERQMKIKLLVLHSLNLEKTKEFYTSLGMKFVKEKHGSGPVHYSAEFDNFVLELYPGKNGESDNLRLGFEVHGLTEIISNLEILDEYEYNSTSIKVVKDPEGRKVELYEIPPELDR